MKRFTAAVVSVGDDCGCSRSSAFAQAMRRRTDERLASATRGNLTRSCRRRTRAFRRRILAGASCVVVVPHFKKGAFVVRRAVWPGRGDLPHRHGWSAPVFVQLEGGSFGFQIGGQSTDLVLVAMNQNGLQHMLHNKFKIGGDAAASAGPVGRNAQAGTDWKLNAEFLTYSRSKGLFAGIDLDGRCCRRTRTTRARCTARTFRSRRC